MIARLMKREEPQHPEFLPETVVLPQCKRLDRGVMSLSTALWSGSCSRVASQAFKFSSLISTGLDRPRPRKSGLDESINGENSRVKLFVMRSNYETTSHAANVAGAPGPILDTRL